MFKCEGCGTITSKTRDTDDGVELCVPCFRATPVAPPSAEQEAISRKIGIALGYIKWTCERPLPELPCDENDMTERERAIFAVYNQAIQSLRFIGREVAALETCGAVDATPSGEPRASHLVLDQLLNVLEKRRVEGGYIVAPADKLLAQIRAIVAPSPAASVAQPAAVEAERWICEGCGRQLHPSSLTRVGIGVHHHNDDKGSGLNCGLVKQVAALPAAVAEPEEQKHEGGVEVNGGEVKNG